MARSEPFSDRQFPSLRGVRFLKSLWERLCCFDGFVQYILSTTLAGVSHSLAYVAAWPTKCFSFDKSGNPILANSIPDDDSTLTVMKGSNGRAGIGVTPSDITATANGNWNVILNGDQEANNIFNVPGNIGLGEQTTNSYFDVLIPADGTYRYGTVRYTRGL